MKPTRFRLLIKENGYQPIPCRGKIPVLDEWTNLGDATPDDIRAWEPLWVGNTGIITKTTPTFDIDLLDAPTVFDISELIYGRFLEHGEILTRTGKAPKCCILFRTDTPFKKITRKLSHPSGRVEKLEFLCEGQLVIVDGIHPDTRQPYTFPDKHTPLHVKRENLPYIDAARAEQLMDDCAAIAVKHGYELISKISDPDPPTDRGPGDPIPSRSDGNASAYVRAALRQECEALAHMPADSGRNNALNTASMKLHQLVAAGSLSQTEVVTGLIDACLANGLIKDDGIRQVKATIRSGAKKGLSEPRQIPTPPQSNPPPLEPITPPQPQGQGSAQQAYDDVREQRHGKSNGAQLPPLIQSSAQFVKDFRPPDYLIDGVAQRRFLYSLTGKTGTGKTAIALRFAAHVGLGRPIGKLEVDQGRVLYFAGENADDVRARWIALAQHMDFDVNTIDVHFIPRRFKISALRKRIEQEIQTIGEIALVIIDTSAAYFEGDNINDNVQANIHASMLRTLTKLPGGPCVLVNCHPVKNAAADNLLPVGGGAFVNEVDGNLTCTISDSAIEVHWQGKFRGPDFAPLSFVVKSVTHQDLKDSKRRLIPTVIAECLSEQAQEDMARSARYHEDQLLAEIEHSPNVSQAELAKALGWSMKDGQPYKSMVKRRAAKLLAAKLITQDRDGYEITPKGRKALKKDNSEDSPKDAAKDARKDAPKPFSIKKLGLAPSGCECAECHSYDPPIYRIRDGRYPDGEIAMLHEGCAQEWFAPDR
jgi:hypothetical protein